MRNVKSCSSAEVHVMVVPVCLHVQPVWPCVLISVHPCQTHSQTG